MSYYVGNGCFYFKDDNCDYLSEMEDFTHSTDEQLDNHAIDIINGDKYRSYPKYDIYGEEIS